MLHILLPIHLNGSNNMKTNNIVIIMTSLLLVLTSLIIVLIVLLPHLHEKKIEKISHLRFSYSTGYHINANVFYEIDLIDGKYILKVKPTDISEEETQEFELSKDKIQEIINKLNEYHVSRWNGFHKSDRNVLDGDSFSLNIRINQDESIEASGYMMWPNNYREVKTYLDTTLGSLYKTE